MRTDSVAALAEQAIGEGGRVISVPRIVSYLRQQFPACEHTDDELAQLVSVIAISQGRNLAFLPVADVPDQVVPCRRSRQEASMTAPPRQAMLSGRESARKAGSKAASPPPPG